MKSWYWIGLLWFLFYSGNGFSQGETFPERGASWPVVTAEQAGFNPDSLTRLLIFIDSNEYRGSRDLRLAILEGFSREPFHTLAGPVKKRGGPAGLILKNGQLVAKWGDLNRVDMTFSVTKSYLSTLVGLAVEEGLIHNLHDPVADYVWDGTFSGKHNSLITWHHLLQQNSDWQGTLFGMEDWADRPPRTGELDDWRYRELVPPGSKYEYNDVRVNVLAYALLQVYREPLPQILKKKIMDPIGASSTWRWYGYDHSFVNVDGVKVQSVSGGGHSGGGVFVSTMDQARFGYLFLNSGNWKGKSIFPSTWINMATTPSEPYEAYGYMWWLNRGDRKVEGVPEDLFYAAGFGGNFIFIDQANDLMVVTRWLDPRKRTEFLAKLYRCF